MSSAVRDLRGEVEELRQAREVPAVRTVYVPATPYLAAPSAPPASTAPVPPEPPSPPEVTTPAEAEERQRADAAATAQALEQTLAKQPVDFSWSRDAVAQIAASIAERASSARVVERKCGSTLCRVVLEHDDASAQRELAQQISDAEPFRAGTIYRHTAATATTPAKTILYVIRAGHQFDEVLGN